MEFEKSNICDNILGMDNDIPMMDDLEEFPQFLKEEIDDYSMLMNPLENNFETNFTYPIFPSYDTGTKSNESFQSPERKFSDFDDTSNSQFPLIDPYEFLNDVVINRDIKIECPSSTRNTPSPSGSSGFSDGGESSNSGSSTTTTDKTQNMLDSPPILSPFSSDSPPISPKPIYISPLNDNSIKIVQGTLIPVTTVPVNIGNPSGSMMKKIKIQPKPINQMTIGNQITKTLNSKKTIVLSSQDFSALVQKAKSQKDNSPPSIVFQNSIKPTATKVLPQIKQNNTMPPSQPSQNSVVRHLDEKSLKKQQRMIKNRESACLSRKKKKEYVISLEHRINELALENDILSNENTELKRRLTAASNGECIKCRQQIILPKSSFSIPIKKNTAFLLAMLVTVSLNFGPINNLLSSQMKNMESSISEQENTFGRKLLWVDEETRSSSNSTAFSYNNSSPNIKADDMYPICPTTQYINQSENIRIASELRRWIGDPDKYNVSDEITQNKSNYDLQSFAHHIPLSKDDMNTFYKQMKLGKDYLKSLKRRKVNMNKIPSISNSLSADRNTDNEVQVFNPGYNSIKYSELFEEIRRRDDTFYVVSFSADHLLLPALAHNKTRRPRMALMLPAVGINDSLSSEFITLMQIDCEVVNTSLIRVREKFIPEHLRSNNNNNNNNNNNGYQNMTKSSSTKDATLNTKVQRKQINPDIRKNFIKNNEDKMSDNYKPYFVEKVGNSEGFVNFDNEFN